MVDQKPSPFICPNCGAEYRLVRVEPQPAAKPLRIRLVTVVIVAAVVGFLGFTKPGHQLLYKFGFTAACSSADCSG